MKKEEMKIGFFVVTASGNLRRIEYVADDWMAAMPWPKHVSNKPRLYTPRDLGGADGIRLATPAELAAAGVPDSLRLVEQQAWREGVELWDVPRSKDGIVRISVDGQFAGYVSDDTHINKMSGDCSDYKINITNDPKRQIYWTFDHFRDFVSKFRSERREAGLKWRKDNNTGCVYRWDGNRVEYFAFGKWEFFASLIRTKEQFEALPDATAELIAPTERELNHIPEPLRTAVRKQREAASPSPAATRTESRPWEWHEGPERGLCQLKNVHTVYRWVRSPTSVDRISLYAIDNEANPHWELKAVEHISSAELHADYEQLDGTPCGIIRESLGTTAGGKSK